MTTAKLRLNFRYRGSGILDVEKIVRKCNQILVMMKYKDEYKKKACELVRQAEDKSERRKRIKSRDYNLECIQKSIDNKFDEIKELINKGKE